MRRSECLSRSMWVVLVGVTMAGVVAPAAPASAAPSWSISPSPNPDTSARFRLQHVTCVSTTNCYAVGSYQAHYGNATLPTAGRWTGSRWSITPVAIPTGGTEDATAQLRGIGCPTTTRCFAVGGYFDGIETGSTLIGQWNGTKWSIVLATNPPGVQQGGFSGATCRNSTTCFAVGSADNSAGSSPLVERWNGTSWSRVPSPNPPSGGNGGFQDVSCSGPTCFAVGNFVSDATGRLQTLVERWNGTVWSVVASPNVAGAAYNSLDSVSCPSATRCFAVGRTQVTAGGGSWDTLIERWNGTAWSIVASPNAPNADFSLLAGVSCSEPSNCTAVGTSIANVNANTRSLIEHWNGAAWSVVASPVQGPRTSLFGVSCPTTTTCIAVGKYEVNNQSFFREQSLIARWNGTSWSQVASGGSDSRLRSVSCVTPTNCFAVGDAFNGFTWNNLIEHWDGTRWAVVAGPSRAGQATLLSGVSCATATMCVAVGQYDSTTSTNPFAARTTKPFIERWDGNTWSAAASPDPGTVTSALLAVTCPTPLACFAVGTRGDANTSKTLIERWNGSSWTIVASPSPGTGGYLDKLSGIECLSATNCFAVGTSDNSYTSKTVVERWNGTSWSIVASPNSSDDYTWLNDVTCTSATNCFAVGGSQTFFLDNGNTIIERWNGTTWSIVPGPDGPYTRELTGVACISATSCTAVGSIGHGVPSTETLAESWNGTSWSIVGTANPVSAYANQLSGIACRSTTCFAVGSSTTDIGESTLVERNS